MVFLLLVFVPPNHYLESQMSHDPIIEELHDFREEIMADCKSKGLSYAEYFNSKGVPEGMVKAKSSPRVIDFGKLEALAPVETRR